MAKVRRNRFVLLILGLLLLVPGFLVVDVNPSVGYMVFVGLCGILALLCFAQVIRIGRE